MIFSSSSKYNGKQTWLLMRRFFITKCFFIFYIYYVWNCPWNIFFVKCKMLAIIITMTGRIQILFLCSRYLSRHVVLLCWLQLHFQNLLNEREEDTDKRYLVITHNYSFFFIEWTSKRKLLGFFHTSPWHSNQHIFNFIIIFCDLHWFLCCNSLKLYTRIATATLNRLKNKMNPPASAPMMAYHTVNIILALGF